MYVKTLNCFFDLTRQWFFRFTRKSTLKQVDPLTKNRLIRQRLITQLTFSGVYIPRACIPGTCLWDVKQNGPRPAASPSFGSCGASAWQLFASGSEKKDKFFRENAKVKLNCLQLFWSNTSSQQCVVYFNQRTRTLVEINQKHLQNAGISKF